jgi:AcrR family transcriptional regulator
MARPRSVACDHAILDAALTEYATNGLDGMSVDAVAARAGVSKATIYRRYPSKAALVVAATFTIAEETAPKPDTGSLRGDLSANLQNLRKLVCDPVLGQAIKRIQVDALQNEELAQMHEEFVAERRHATRAQLERAIERGELRDDTDLDFALDTIAAPLFYRHLVSRAPITRPYIDKIVDEFIARYGVLQSAGFAGPSRQS